MDFYERVTFVCGKIPYGRVATYGQIALLCGKPGNSRQVGYALNHKVFGVPAHRVVNSKGFLSGAAAFSTPDEQRILLEGEGVELTDSHVDLKKYGWHNTLEEAMEILAHFSGSASR